MATTGDRCALLSRDRGESLAGTASRVTRWVVVEQPGAWGQDALVDSKLDEQIGRTLKSAGLRHGFRPLLMRRPGWRKPEGTRRVYLARTMHGGGWIEQVDFDDPGALARLDWGALDSSTPPGIGVAGPAAVHLVCTNGRHDPCCADEGRPVVRALDDAGVPEVWESTHLGGDRFAANIATLPIGVYHGRVDAEQAVAVVGDVSDGLVTLDRYRGRSCFSPLAQAAEYFARIELDERRILGVTVAGGERRGEHGLSVRFEHEAGTVEVVVRRERADRELLTCTAAPARPWRYVLESLTR
jgi:hypothetical protein